jgi:glucose/arabinose dehydrogenase
VRSAPAVLLLFALAACSEDSPNDSPNDPTPMPSGNSGPCSVMPVAGTPPLTTTRIAGGLSQPVDLQAPRGDRRLFVVEQPGRIRILRDGSVLPTPFLDIVARVGSGGERGLLGLAFHPQYGTNGRFFVNYTDRAGDTHIAEFRVSNNPDVADPATERQILFVQQPFSNHNGGALAFGPDGMLYIGLGDGGSGGDPFRNAQNLATPLGKLLRIDVSGTTSPFVVPPDNPFVGRAGAFPSIWSLGLRNPWRFSFDATTGDLYIGDVGQNQVEEIDFQPARRGGDNWGWNTMEGSRCFQPSSGCDRTGLSLPIVEYTHADGCSVTGGYVYRGCRMPGYHGTYFYGDYCSAFIQSFKVAGGRATEPRDWTSALQRGIDQISSFGADGEGELYILDHQGEIYKIVPGS